MTDRSDFDKPEAWRDRNLDVIKRSHLFSDGAIRCSYVEMFGNSGWKMLERLRPYLLDARQFIGVDRDAIVTYDNRRSMAEMPEKDWFEAPLDDFFHCCLDVVNPENTAPRPSAAIFNIDETRQTSSARWWTDHGRSLVEIVSCALVHHPEAILLLNCSLDRNGARLDEQLKSMTVQVCEYFRKWSPERIAFLGRNYCEARAVDHRFGWNEPTWMGAFQIYRSNARSVRMATLRLKFDTARMRVDHPVASG